MNALATSVAPLPRGGVEVRYLDLERRAQRRIEARAAIVATPAFVAARLLPPAIVQRNEPLLQRRPAAPWLVANLHVRRPIEPNLPWDSVLHDASGLGYVDAAHQRMAPTERRVLTYYRAFGGPDTAAARTALLQRDWTELASEVLLDLAPAHPELASQTERLDVMVWGHGMPRPQPGFLGAKPFRTQPLLDAQIAWAHVDQTGFALFEEANQRGVRAGEAIADAIGAARGESWL
jgi:hypothetical protein